MHQADAATNSALVTKADSSIVSIKSIRTRARTGRRKHSFVIQRGDWVRGVALGYHVAGAIFTAAALRGHTELELDFVKPQSGARVACNLTVRDTSTNTNNHGEPGLLAETMMKIF